MPVESSIAYQDWNGSVLKTVTKVWAAADLLGAECVTLSNGTAGTFYTYESSAPGSGALYGLADQVTDKKEYDYGLVSSSCALPTTTPTRETKTVYQSFSPTPIYPGVKSMLDRPSSVQVYDHGALIAETDYSYDQTAVSAVSPTATGHDETNYSPSYNNRGNLTTKTVKCLQSGCSNAVTTYTFDETGQVLSVQDPCGNASCSDMPTGSSHTTSYSYADNYTTLSGGSNVPYTSSGNTNTYVTATTDPLGHQQAFSYDYNSGQVTQSQDQNDLNTKRTGTTYTYNDPFYRPTFITHPDGGQTTYTYTDSATPSVTNTTLLSSSSSIITTTTEDGMGHPTTTVLSSDPSGAVSTVRTYDGLGRVHQSYNPTRCSTPTTNCGESTWGITTYTDNALGQTTTVAEPDGSVAQTAYYQINPNSTGTCSTVTDEAGKPRQSCADAFGRVTGVWEDPGSSPHLNYETDYTYNALNDLTYANQKGSNSSNARTRSFMYDSLSRLTSATNPESGQITYGYDANGNLTSRTAPSPNQPTSGTKTVTTTYTYDALNRLTGKSYTDAYNGNLTPSVTSAYDGGPMSCPSFVGWQNDTIPNNIGRRTSMCFGGGSTSWQYDPMGRVKAENDVNTWGISPPYSSVNETSIKGVPTVSVDTGYYYYLNGDFYYLTYPAGTPNYESYLNYDSAGHVIALGDAIYNIMTNATYTPSGQLATAVFGSFGNGDTQISNTYNNRLQPVLISASTASGTPILNLTYNFNLGNGTTGNDNGNVIQIVNGKDNNRSQNFLYDSLNRIQQAYSTGPNWGETYSPTATAPGVAPTTPGIDAWGNLTNRSTVTGKTNSESQMNCAPANNSNQLNTCFTYDAAGNLIQNGSVTYTYDAENRLIATEGTSYVYDGDGNRVEKCTEGSTPGTCAGTSTGTLYWYHQGGGVLAEADLGGNPTAAYGLIHGQIVTRTDLPANVIHYYFHDNLGSTSVVTDTNGDIQNESDYYPYGGEIVIIGTVPNHYKFTGKERDAESGLDNFTARYYGSSLGRFMTADDGSDQDPGNPQSWNLYSYVRNNPVSNTDPTGRCSYSNGTYTPDSVSDCSEVEDKSVPPTVTVTATPGSAPAAIALNAFFALDNLANDFFAPIVGRPSYMQNTPTGTGGAAKLGAGIGFIASMATPGGEEAEVESIAEKIATGHAFGKHAAELGVASKAELQSLIKRIIEGADTANDVRELSGGRVAFWDDAKKAVVIFNPNAVDKGTVFVPKQGRYYFDVVLK